MLGIDPHQCAHQIQADWIAPPSGSLLAAVGHSGVYAGFRHAVTNELLMVELVEAYQLITAPAIVIRQALTLDGRRLEAIICCDQRHTGQANCHMAFASALRLVLPEAS